MRLLRTGLWHYIQIKSQQTQFIKHCIFRATYSIFIYSPLNHQPESLESYEFFAMYCFSRNGVDPRKMQPFTDQKGLTKPKLLLS